MLKLVFKLKEIPDFANFLSLFLEASALDLYLEMSEDEQQDNEMIELILKKTFMTQKGQMNWRISGCVCQQY